MPKTVQIDQEKQEKLLNQGGLAQGTVDQRNYVSTSIEAFLKANGYPVLAELVINPDVTFIESVLCDYFTSLRLNSGDLPKRNYFDSIKSHTKMKILQLTGGALDITSMKFAKLSTVLKGLHRELKVQGLGDTKHYPELPTSVLGQIFQAFHKVTQFAQAWKNGDHKSAMELWNDLPDSYQSKPNLLMQHAVTVTIILADLRRGREGLAELQKDHFEKKVDHETGQHYFQKTKGELSKNHRTDKENMENTGLIIKTDNMSEFDPGLLFEIYCSSLNPDNDFLFQRPKLFKDRNNFLLSSVLFDNIKVGKNPLGNTLPLVTKALGLPKFTNHSLRGTGIRLLKRMGYEDRDIAKISGHKRLDSLNNYDPAPTFHSKKRASLLLTGNCQEKKKKTENVMQPGTSVLETMSGQGTFDDWTGPVIQENTHLANFDHQEEECGVLVTEQSEFGVQTVIDCSVSSATPQTSEEDDVCKQENILMLKQLEIILQRHKSKQ